MFSLPRSRFRRITSDRVAVTDESIFVLGYSRVFDATAPLESPERMSVANDPHADLSPRTSLNGMYLVGVLMRIVFVAALILGGLSLLEFLKLGVDSRRGLPITIDEASLAHLLAVCLPLLVPIIVALLIAECQIILLRSVRFSTNVCLVLIPASLAVLGGWFGYLFFVDDPPVAPVDRMFVFGGALVFYLAGSFQMWFWQQQCVANPSPRTPIAWYALALCVAGGFLGSLMAWQGPSPYARSIIDYYHHAWVDRDEYPTLPIEPTNDTPL